MDPIDGLQCDLTEHGSSTVRCCKAQALFAAKPRGYVDSMKCLVQRAHSKPRGSDSCLPFDLPVFVREGHDNRLHEDHRIRHAIVDMVAFAAIRIHSLFNPVFPFWLAVANI